MNFYFLIWLRLDLSKFCEMKFFKIPFWINFTWILSNCIRIPFKNNFLIKIFKNNFFKLYLNMIVFQFYLNLKFLQFYWTQFIKKFFKFLKILFKFNFFKFWILLLNSVLMQFKAQKYSFILFHFCIFLSLLQFFAPLVFFKFLVWTVFCIKKFSEKLRNNSQPKY